MHICVTNLDHHWFRWWLVTCSAPNHYLNQYWSIVNWTLDNIVHWNLNQNTLIFIEENAFENAVWKTAVILSRLQGDNKVTLVDTLRPEPNSRRFPNYIFTWWRHQMETFSALLAICAGNPHKGQWGGALMFSLICIWINGWVNNREAGDLTPHRTYYDVIVMIYDLFKEMFFFCF